MKTRILFVSALVALGLSSCKKEVEPTPEPSTQETFASLQAYLDTKSVPTQTFTFTAESGATFTAAKGSVITIPANALIDQNGNAVTGTVTLNFKEVFSASDMMFSGVFPVSSGYVLNSGGEYFISVTQGGNELRVANGQMINVDIPSQAEDPGMLLFFADEAQLQNPQAGWAPADSIGGSGFTFNSVDSTYDITLDSLCWGNIDAFNWSVSYFDMTFDLTGLSGLDNSNTTAFAIFDGQNTVWPVGTSTWGNITANTITETHLADVPMTIVVISVVGGQLYYGTLAVTPTQGTNYSILMQETTSAVLDAYLAGFE